MNVNNVFSYLWNAKFMSFTIEDLCMYHKSTHYPCIGTCVSDLSKESTTDVHAFIPSSLHYLSLKKRYMQCS